MSASPNRRMHGLVFLFALLVLVRSELPAEAGGPGAFAQAMKQVFGGRTVNLSGTATDGHVATYDSGTNSVRWEAVPAAAASGWTDSGASIATTTSSDRVGIGAAAASGTKFRVLGDAINGDITIVSAEGFRVEFLTDEGTGFAADAQSARVFAPSGEVAIQGEGSGGGVTWVRFLSDAGPILRFGAGSPEGAITAPQGSIYGRLNGGNGTTLYVKTSGDGSTNTGWRAVSDAAP